MENTNNHNGEHKEILEAIGDLAIQIDRRFAQVDQRFDYIEQRLDNMSARLDMMEKDLADIKVRLANLEKHTIEDADALAKDVIKLKERVSWLEDQIKQLRVAPAQT